MGVPHPGARGGEITIAITIYLATALGTGGGSELAINDSGGGGVERRGRDGGGPGRDRVGTEDGAKVGTGGGGRRAEARACGREG